MKRRTLFWAAPAVPLSAAAPAFATSQTTSPVAAAWRTNHGHQRIESGKHSYHLILDTEAAAVYVDGEPATSVPSTRTWTTAPLRGGVNRNVLVVLTDGEWTGIVRFQPVKL